MSLFSDLLWLDNSSIYEAILDNKFIRDLSRGVLDRTKFQYYIQQDALYLADFGKALALLAVKSESQEDMLQFIRFAEGAIVVERALHQSYFQSYNISGIKQKAPACFAYTNYLLSTTALQPLEVGVAAVLPCFWVYREVGKYILKTSVTDNPYQQWIDTYAGDEFDALVTQMISITNRLSEQTTDLLRDRMKEAFMCSCRLEWYFWNDAYTENNWLL